MKKQVLLNTVGLALLGLSSLLDTSTASAFSMLDLVSIDRFEDGVELGFRNGDLISNRVLTRTLQREGYGLDCGELVNFEDTLKQVTASVQAPALRNSEFKAGFYQGYLTAIRNKVREVRLACQKTAYPSGVFAGDLYSTIYCNAARAGEEVVSQVGFEYLYNGWSENEKVREECIQTFEIKSSECGITNRSLLEKAMKASCKDEEKMETKASRGLASAGLLSPNEGFRNTGVREDRRDQARDRARDRNGSRLPRRPLNTRVRRAPPVRVVRHRVPLPRNTKIVVRGSDRLAGRKPQHYSSEDHVVAFFMRYVENMRCEQVGDLLRKISNEIFLANAGMDSDSTERRSGEVPLRMLIRRPGFMRFVVERLNQIYGSCNRDCFEDGEAIGQLMAVSYCHVAEELDGLGDGDVLLQQPLPMCETGNFVGCKNGYEKTAWSIASCIKYTRDEFSNDFASSVSEDCHLD